MRCSLLALLVACAPPASGPGQSFVLVVLDDVGTDKVSVYGEHPDSPATPNIDGLADQGVLFRNAYSTPVCTPSRAALFTGRHGRRYGVGQVLHESSNQQVPPTEMFLPEVLDQSPWDYESVMVGKYHLAGHEAPSGLNHPQRAGFDIYSGSYGNLASTTTSDKPGDYFRWEKTVNGVPQMVDNYAVTETVDDALILLETLEPPFLLVVSLQAAHGPWHVPPAELLPVVPAPDAPIADLYDASVVAADAEVGRLMAGVGSLERTTVVLTADNGTNKAAVRAPRLAAHGKGSMYEGGINVPFVVAGAAVADPGRESAELVHLVDVLPTLAELAGVDLEQVTSSRELDGLSLVPVLDQTGGRNGREVLYTGRFKCTKPPCDDTDDQVVRDARYKLIRRVGQADELYDLEGRYDDGPDLLVDQGLAGVLAVEAQQAYTRLSAMLDLKDVTMR